MEVRVRTAQKKEWRVRELDSELERECRQGVDLLSNTCHHCQRVRLEGFKTANVSVILTRNITIIFPVVAVMVPQLRSIVYHVVFI